MKHRAVSLRQLSFLSLFLLTARYFSPLRLIRRYRVCIVLQMVFTLSSRAVGVAGYVCGTVWQRATTFLRRLR